MEFASFDDIDDMLENDELEEKAPDLSRSKRGAPEEQGVGSIKRDLNQSKIKTRQGGEKQVPPAPDEKADQTARQGGGLAETDDTPDTTPARPTGGEASAQATIATAEKVATKTVAASSSAAAASAPLWGTALLVSVAAIIIVVLGIAIAGHLLDQGAR